MTFFVVECYVQEDQSYIHDKAYRTKEEAEKACERLDKENPQYAHVYHEVSVDGD